MLIKRLKNNGIALLKLNKVQLKAKQEVDNKIATNQYKFEEICCPICGKTDKDVIGEKDRYGFYYPANICAECGLVYVSPRMSQDSYNDFYNTVYRQLYVGKEIATDKFFMGQYKKGERIYNFIANNTDKLNKQNLFVLEIGCGAGGILEYFKQKGHKVKGIDLGQEYINYGKNNHNLDLEVNSLQNFTPNQTPDIIIYSHVFEHILDLNNEINNLKNIINSNTLVYIEVPGIKEIHKNYKSDILLYFQNAHVFNFSLESLTNIFCKNNFKLLYGNQYVQSIFQLDETTNTEFTYTSDYKAIKDYILSAEQKRPFYPFTMHSIKRTINQRIYNVMQILGLKPKL